MQYTTTIFALNGQLSFKETYRIRGKLLTLTYLATISSFLHFFVQIQIAQSIFFLLSEVLGWRIKSLEIFHKRKNWMNFMANPILLRSTKVHIYCWWIFSILTCLKRYLLCFLRNWNFEVIPSFPKDDILHNQSIFSKS